MILRKLTYYVACSVDGFIARSDGSLDDFNIGGEHFADLLQLYPESIPGHLREQLDVSADNQRFDTVLMGRSTYDVGLNIGVTSPYPHLRQFVVSRSMKESPSESVTLIGENPVDLVQSLKQQSGLDIWLCGGGNLAAALIDEIDEYILKVNPFLMGTGIPLVAGNVVQKLNMTGKRVYDNGFMLLNYLPAR